MLWFPSSCYALDSIITKKIVLFNRPFAPLIRDTEITECFILFLFADPGGIGFAFHWAGKAKRDKPKPFGHTTLFLINSVIKINAKPDTI